MGNGQENIFCIVCLTFLLGSAKYNQSNSRVRADEPLQYSPKPRRVDHDTETGSSCFLYQFKRSIPTFGAPGSRDTCISPSLRLSGSSGRGSAAAGIRPTPPQEGVRFARKPLTKTH